MAHGPYSRVYHSLMDHYPEVWTNDARLALFMRLLVLAEKFYPQRPPIPSRKGAYLALVDVGLILEDIGRGTFTIRGLAEERERRSDVGRTGAAIRWERERNANALHSKDETRKDEKRASALHDGQHGMTCLPCAALLKEMAS